MIDTQYAVMYNCTLLTKEEEDEEQEEEDTRKRKGIRFTALRKEKNLLSQIRAKKYVSQYVPKLKQQIEL